jgi:hypothetical protein
VRLRAVLAGAATGPAPLRVVSVTPGDGEARNDTLTLAFDVGDAPAAVFASGAPDYDARLLVGILRGTLATPVRAYYRVAPGQWRNEGSLAPVAEADVRRAAAGASLLVLHGDTAVLGRQGGWDAGRSPSSSRPPPLTPASSGTPVRRRRRP